MRMTSPSFTRSQREKPHQFRTITPNNTLWPKLMTIVKFSLRPLSERSHRLMILIFSCFHIFCFITNLHSSHWSQNPIKKAKTKDSPGKSRLKVSEGRNNSIELDSKLVVWWLYIVQTSWAWKRRGKGRTPQNVNEPGSAGPLLVLFWKSLCRIVETHRNDIMLSLLKAWLIGVDK